jgi:hypothetical protein
MDCGRRELNEAIMRAIVTCLLLSLASTSVFAQARPPRPSGPAADAKWFVALNAAAQNGAGAFRDNFTYEAFAETGSIDAEYPGKTAAMFDIAVGRRVWRRLGLGAGFSRASASGGAPLSARVPHPLYPNQHRDVSGEAGGIDRTESATHAQLFYDFPPRGNLRVRVAAGPSFFNAEQQIVEAIETSEVYPYDTTEFRTATVKNASGSGVGVHVALDVSWMFSRRFGVGGLVRFTRASFDLEADGSRSVPSDAGGFQAGGGFRIAF